ncbi:SRPBCC family protein [Nocardioides lijunqiniae]|uniref:SRPBCC family protein n=1 Tax=Nocardioides lijunqiniae TaxID=2760832 RepID=UPI001877F46C|nr:SRPBCC family protein [Nocardioides lijunqiniae]
MTFRYERTVTTTADPAEVWALWSDTDTWPDWDPAVQAVTLDGAFVEGVTGTMTLTGPIEVPVTLDVVVPGSRYLDRLTMGELVIRIDHVIRPTPEGAEVTVTTTIEGPGADDIGPMVTADAPVAMEALVVAAERA